MEIKLAHDKRKQHIKYEISTNDFQVVSEQHCDSGRDTTIGRLTGVQLRAVSSLDQLEAMMQHELADVIRYIAVVEDYDKLSAHIRDVMGLNIPAVYEPDESEHWQTFLKALKSMALFCYRELIDRGMVPPHEPNQEPNDGEQ